MRSAVNSPAPTCSTANGCAVTIAAWMRAEQLGTAHEMFATMGMEAFAQRAARELRATGARPASAPSRPPSRLTAQETQIARLVCEGLSNPEIAARLFLSPRTVEWHLTKIFAKLNITSRKDLTR